MEHTIKKLKHTHYVEPKRKEEYIRKYNPSSLIGKYAYIVDGDSIVRFIPLKPIATKNWLRGNKKLTPFYEVLIGQSTVKFWHLQEAIDYIKSGKHREVYEYDNE